MLNGEQALVPAAEQAGLFQMLAEGASDVLVLLSPDHRRLYVSPSCQKVMGYSADELLGGRADGLVHDEDLGRVAAVMGCLSESVEIAQAEWRMRCRDGTYRWMESRYRRLPGGNVVTGIRDVQDRKDIEVQLLAALERVERLAMQDQLTGLPNRRCFMESLERQVLHAGPDNEVVLLLLDLDDFKAVNDRFGHTAGDAVLIEAGRRLRTAVPGQFVARLGGDEFAILVDVWRIAELEGIAAAVIAAVTMPIEFGPRMLHVGVSIGIASSSDCGADYRMLLSHADTAMYQVKRKKEKSGHCFYRPSLEVRPLDGADFRRALANGEILPYYQPLVSLADGRIVSFEALARWLHPAEGCLEPERFIHLIDEGQLHDELFATIMLRAAADALTWPSATGICVNVAPSQMSSRTFPGHLAELLSQAGLPPSRVTLEMTEIQVTKDWATAQDVFDDLRLRGFKIILDDFGTGHSGLKTLRQLQFDGLKIDRLFVLPDATGRAARQYLPAIVEFGLRLGLEVTAEGIEDGETAAIARSLGCSFGQGFFFGRPVPGRLVIALLQDQSRLNTFR